MPKINALRVVNYRYNDGKRVWLDETFDFKGGHNALITLQNGGGKTVLIQGIMQVVNPNISLRKRRWKGFFTQEGVPTYLMIEWLLDDGVSYATTGVGFQLRQGKLESYMFITTYKESTPYDIRHLKLTEEENETLHFTPLSTFRKKMTELRQACVARGLSMAIRTFDTQTQYHQGLRELNINHEEWKVMMRKINEAEGGMNEVFENTGTTERVVRELILPQIEQKLIQQSELYDVANPTSSLFNETHLQLNGLVEEKVRLEEKIEAKERLLTLNELILQDLLPQKEIYQSYLSKKEEQLLQVVQLETLLTQSIQELKNGQAQLEQDLIQLESDDRRYRFEKKSYDYHLIQAKRESKQQELQRVEMSLTQATAELAEAIDLKNQLEAAYYHHRQTQYEQKRLAKKQMIQQLQAKDVDLEAQLRETGGQIRSLIEAELSHLNQAIQALEASVSRISSEILTLKQAQKNKQSEVTSLDVSLLMAEKTLEKVEQDFVALFESYPQWQLLDQTLTSIEQLQTQTQSQQSEVNRQYETLIHQWESTQTHLDSLTTKKQNISDTLKDTHHQFEQNQQAQERFLTQKNQMYERLKAAYQVEVLEPNAVYQKDQHLQHFTQVKDSLEQDFVSLKQQEFRLNEELTRLNAGCHLEFPAEFLAFLDQHQMVYQTGFEFLSNYESSTIATAAQSILAHALILTPRDLEQLRRIQHSWETDFIIPLINRDQLLEWLAIQEQGIVSSQGMLDLVSYFNPQWLDADYLEQQKEKLKIELTELKTHIKTTQQQTTFYSRILTELDLFPLTEKEEEDFELTAEALLDKGLALEGELAILSQSIEAATQEKERLKQQIQNLETVIDEISQTLKAIESFKALVKTQQTTRQTKEEVSAQLTTTQAELEALTLQVEQLDALLTSTKEQIRANQSNVKELHRELLTYQGYEGRETTETKDFLVQLFIQLKGKRSEHELTILETEIGELNKDIQECQDTIASLSLTSTDYLAMSVSSLSHALDQEKVVEAKRHQEQEISHQQVELLTEIKGLTESLETIHQETMDAFQQSPQSLESIDVNFKTRMTDLKQRKHQLKETSKDLKATEEVLNQKDRELTRILDLVQPEELSLIKTHFFSETELSSVLLETTNLPHLFEQLTQLYRSLASIQGKWTTQLEQVFELFKGQSLFEPLLVALRQLEPNTSDYVLTGCQIFERQLTKNEAILNKLEKDLSGLEDLFHEFKRDCVAMAQNIHDEIKLFGKGIAIQWKGVRQQLIQLKAPQPTVDLESTMDQYVSDTLELLMALYHEGKLAEMEEQISTRFNVDAFLNLLTPIQSYKLLIFKIEIQQEQSTYKAWEDLVVKASGGERFFASFVLSAAILTYSRYDRTLKDISKMGKVLLMDNPFGVVTSQHLLKPVFELAKKLNIQMLCFTGISEIGIYDNFELVYALKVEGLTAQLSKIEMSVKKEPEDYIQTFYYFKQDALAFE